MKCVPDTGAMVTCAGPAMLHKLNMAQGALIPTSQSIVAANNKTLHIMGAVMLEIRTEKEGNKGFSPTGVNGIRHMEEDRDDKDGRNEDVTYDAQKVAELCGAELAEWGCQVRSKPPLLPETMPFEEREVDKLQQWLLDRYAASAFNV